MLTKDDVGKLFTSGATDGKGRRDVWRMISYASDPTVCMVNCESGERSEGTVDSLNIRAMKRLVVEEK